MSILYILLAVVVLLFMVLIHELGHYLAGRMLKFKITEFSIGFGKAIFSRTNKRGEKISLRLFLLGGYCAFYGDEDENDKDPKSFINQKPWKRIIVFFAGVFFNFISAIIFSFILLVSYGYDIREITEISPTNINSYEYVNEFGVQNTAQGLKVGDAIYAVDGEKVDFAFGRTLEEMLAEKAIDGNDVTLTIKRDGQWMDKTITFFKVEKEPTADNIHDAMNTGSGAITEIRPAYSIVIGVSMKSHPLPFGEALARCVPFAFGLAWVVLKSLWLLITFQVPINQVGGPITTISMIASYSQSSLINLLFLIPAIAANLAVFNLLPFPALDGSHIVFTLIEWIRGKPINRKIENYIHFGGLVLLFGFVIIVDILHFLL